MTFKLTKQRKEIIDVFAKSDKPLSAEMVFVKLNNQRINLSTVYRNIEMLMRANLIGKLYLNNLAYYYYNHHNHVHYMVCEQCHHMVEIDCVHEQFNHVAEANNFKITHHDLVIYGLCKECLNH
jgi:Fur family ferric uptake transcriptional regulator